MGGKIVAVGKKVIEYMQGKDETIEEFEKIRNAVLTEKLAELKSKKESQKLIGAKDTGITTIDFVIFQRKDELGKEIKDLEELCHSLTNAKFSSDPKFLLSISKELYIFKASKTYSETSISMLDDEGEKHITKILTMIANTVNSPDPFVMNDYQYFGIEDDLWKEKVTKTDNMKEMSANIGNIFKSDLVTLAKLDMWYEMIEEAKYKEYLKNEDDMWISFERFNSEIYSQIEQWKLKIKASEKFFSKLKEDEILYQSERIRIKLNPKLSYAEIYALTHLDFKDKQEVVKISGLTQGGFTKGRIGDRVPYNALIKSGDEYFLIDFGALIMPSMKPITLCEILGVDYSIVKAEILKAKCSMVVYLDQNPLTKEIVKETSLIERELIRGCALVNSDIVETAYIWKLPIHLKETCVCLGIFVNANIAMMNSIAKFLLDFHNKALPTDILARKQVVGVEQVLLDLNLTEQMEEPDRLKEYKRGDNDNQEVFNLDSWAFGIRTVRNTATGLTKADYSLTESGNLKVNKDWIEKDEELEKTLKEQWEKCVEESKFVEFTGNKRARTEWYDMRNETDVQFLVSVAKYKSSLIDILGSRNNFII